MPVQSNCPAVYVTARAFCCLQEKGGGGVGGVMTMVEISPQIGVEVTALVMQNSTAVVMHILLHFLRADIVTAQCLLGFKGIDNP